MRGQFVRIIHQAGTYPEIVPDYSETLGDQTGCSSSQVRLGTKALSGSDAYKGWGIKVTSGTNSGEIHTVTTYNGATKIATLDKSWTKQNPAAGSMIVLAVPGKAKYLGLTGRAVLSFAELEVYSDWAAADSGINLAKGGTATMSGSGLGGDGKSYPASNAVDGNYANFTLSGYDGTGPVWWMVDLKKEVDIAIIRLVNRRDFAPERLYGFQFQILNSSSKVIFTSNQILNTMHAHEVFPPSTAVQGTMSSTGLGSSSFFTQFSPFSACTAPCGGGTRKRVRGMIPNSDGRLLSNNPADLVQIEPCNTQTCPVFSTWSDYGDCVADKKTRTRKLLSGTAGPGDLLSETTACTLAPVFSDWSPYSECVNDKKTRTRKVLSGTTSNPTDLLDTAPCTVAPTVFTDWTDYGDCVSGKKTRTRTVFSGTKWSPSDLLDTADCTAATQPAPTASSNATTAAAATPVVSAVTTTTAATPVVSTDTAATTATPIVSAVITTTAATPAVSAAAVTTSAGKSPGPAQIWEDNKVGISIAIAVVALILIIIICKCCLGSKSRPSAGLYSMQ